MGLSQYIRAIAGAVVVSVAVLCTGCAAGGDSEAPESLAVCTADPALREPLAAAIAVWNAEAVAEPSLVRGKHDVQRTITHELGHVLGLGHSEDPADIMHAQHNPLVRQPSAEDFARLPRDAPALLLSDSVEACDVEVAWSDTLKDSESGRAEGGWIWLSSTIVWDL